jgi:hypothetical protein
MPEALRSFLAALGWLAAVVVIALGAAGIVTAMDAPPEAGSRPELTARGDAAVTPALDAIESDLDALAADIEALGTQARGALAALSGSDIETVEAAIAEGDTILDRIGRRTASIAADLRDVPLLGTPAAEFEVSTAVRERAARLTTALGSTRDLDDAWERLTTGSVAATRMAGLLAAHDEAVLAAARLGREARYSRAIRALEGATAAIDDARRLRNVLANTVDVSTLDEWLDRNADYDAALSELYRALRDVGGRVTNDVRDAIAAEKAAKERLPGNASGLVLIMSDIGRGGMNGAVIAIEEARGRIADALEPVASPMPSVVP